MRGFHFYFKALPAVRAYVARPFRYGVTGSPHGCLSLVLVVAALFMATCRRADGQVDAVLHLAGRDAAMTVANPTAKPLRVAITLFRDSTLTDSVPCRISPSTFTLDPGASQMVRLRLRARPASTARYRLGTLFTPAEQPRPTMSLTLAVRMVTRIQVQP